MSTKNVTESIASIATPVNKRDNTASDPEVNGNPPPPSTATPNRVLLAGEGGEDELEANENYVIVDIGANLTNKKFSRDLDSVVGRAQDAGNFIIIYNQFSILLYKFSILLYKFML